MVGPFVTAKTSTIRASTKTSIFRILALKKFPLAPRRRITVEYVMLKGVNDSVADAKRLSVLLRGLRCKVNLIPFNEHKGSVYRRPDERAVHAFQETLAAAHYTAFIRDSRGADILAACGQLRAAKSA